MKVFPDKARVTRRRGVLALAAVVAALAASGAAFAFHGGFGSASPVAATFFANTVANSQSQTCTAANNDSIQITSATYTGTAASSDANLNGPITLQVKSVFDATTNAGSVTGFARIGTPGSSSGFAGGFVAVNTAGHLQGLLSGREGGGGSVLANFSASFSATGGFSSSSAQATIGGSGAATNTAIVSTGNCVSANMHGNDDEDDNGSGSKSHGFNFGQGLNVSRGFFGTAHHSHHG